jgi:hypothetical protein
MVESSLLVVEPPTIRSDKKVKKRPKTISVVVFPALEM